MPLSLTIALFVLLPLAFVVGFVLGRITAPPDFRDEKWRR